MGEREARIFSGLVAQRHYFMGHGMGRSGDLMAHQPKAVGSSMIVKLTNRLALHSIKLAGITNAKECIVVPLATGMAITMSLLTLKNKRPSTARYVLWPRIDQKTCLKAIYTAGLECIVIENVLEGDEIRTNLIILEKEIQRIGPENIVCVLSTSSCFAPRCPDKVVEIAKLCQKYVIGHVINNAYGIQCASTCQLIKKVFCVCLFF